MARARSRRRTVTHRRRAPRRHKTVARRRTTYRANSHRRTRRRKRHTYRRNPGVRHAFARGRGLIGGIMSLAKEGAIGGLSVMGGRVSARMLPDVTGIEGKIAASGMDSVMATAALAVAQISSGLIMATLVDKMFGRKAAVFVAAGAFDAVIEDVANGASQSNFPLIGKYLGDGASTLDASARAMGFGSYSRRAPVAGYSHTTPRIAGYSGGKTVNVRRIGMAGGMIAR